MPASLSPPRSSSSPLTSLSLEAEAFPGPSAPAIPEAAGAEAGASGGAEKDGQDGKKKKNRC